MIDIKKSQDLLDKLTFINSTTRANILDILIRVKKPISVTELHKELSKHGYNISYKNVAENVNKLKDKGFIKINKIKDTVGQCNMISITEMGDKITNFVYGMELMVDDKYLKKILKHKK